jgi:hypothetical protein
MANTDVSLDVRNFPSNGSDGYTNTTASNNAVYSYQYGGGSDGHGNTDETVGSGSATVTVSLHSDPRYTIAGVTISGDIENQLSYAPPGNGATSVSTSDHARVTKLTDYATVVLTVLARDDPEAVLQRADLAERARPGARRRVAKLLKPLAQAGLVEASAARTAATGWRAMRARSAWSRSSRRWKARWA